MSISFLFDGNIVRFKEFSKEFFERNNELKHPEMEMEMLILSGFIYNFVGDLSTSKNFFTKGLQQAQLNKKDFYKAVCLSNLGVIDAEEEFEDAFAQLEIDMENYNNKEERKYRINENLHNEEDDELNEIHRDSDEDNILENEQENEQNEDYEEDEM